MPKAMGMGRTPFGAPYNVLYQQNVDNMWDKNQHLINILPRYIRHLINICSTSTNNQYLVQLLFNFRPMFSPFFNAFSSNFPHKNQPLINLYTFSQLNCSESTLFGIIWMGYCQDVDGGVNIMVTQTGCPSFHPSFPPSPCIDRTLKEC